jgi:hypothetical protein
VSTRRCCIECDLLYVGPIECPACNGMGEPVRGRPPLPAGIKKTCRVEVRVTHDELAQIDNARGAETRSDYLARLAREVAAPTPNED